VWFVFWIVALTKHAIFFDVFMQLFIAVLESSQQVFSSNEALFKTMQQLVFNELFFSSLEYNTDNSFFIVNYCFFSFICCCYIFLIILLNQLNLLNPVKLIMSLIFLWLFKILSNQQTIYL
jgi:hypothetical protein